VVTDAASAVVRISFVLAMLRSLVGTFSRGAGIVARQKQAVLPGPARCMRGRDPPTGCDSGACDALAVDPGAPRRCLLRRAADQRDPPAVRLLDRRSDGGHDATRGFHTLTFHITMRPEYWKPGTSSKRYPSARWSAPGQFQQVNVKAWLIGRI